MTTSPLLRLPVPLRGQFDRWFDAADSGRATLIALALFVVTWTLFHSVTYLGVGLHPDLTEIYDWGRHPSPGYYKHPPLGGLMTAAWFAVFPASDWAFHLLAMVNAAAALYITDLIARRYITGDKRLLVLLLLLLLPFYQFHAQRFASNQTLLATWPLATYCFLRAFDTRNITWSLAAGAAAALAMLGKYYSIYLIGGFVIAALSHPARLRYLKSPSPWLSCAAGLMVLSPHIYWLVATGFQPFSYAYTVHGGTSLAQVLAHALGYLIGCIGYIALPAAVYWLAVWPSRGALRDALWPDDPDRRMLVILLGCFILLPPLSAPFLDVLLTSLWSMHAWFLLPIVLLASPPIDVQRRAAAPVAAGVAILTIAAVVVAAPVQAVRNFNNGGSDSRGYTRQLAGELTREWNELVGRPLPIVLGDEKLSAALAFYSPDHPDSVPGFNLALTPWISPGRLRASGFVALCTSADTSCINQSAQMSADNPQARRYTLTIVPRFFGINGAPARFSVVIVPPKGVASLAPDARPPA